MTSLRKLPRVGTWEVVLVPPPPTEAAAPALAGILLVADAHAGTVRSAQAVLLGQDLHELLVAAASAPASGLPPRRPRTVACRPELAPQLSRGVAGLGANLIVEDELPLADDMAAELLARLSPSPTGLRPADTRPWKRALVRLVHDEPWRHLGDRVEFHFPDGPPQLADGVALVLGRAGEQFGVVFYPRRRDLEVFQTLDSSTPSSAWPDFEVWAIHLDPVEEFEPDDLEELERAGLRFGDRALRLFVLSKDPPRTLRPDEEQAALAVVQGVVGLWRARGDRLASEVSRVTVDTALGGLTVEATPGPDPADEPLLLMVSHQIYLTGVRRDGRELEALVWKGAKKDAVRLAEMVGDVDGVSVEQLGGGHVQVVLWSDEEVLGVLARLPATAASFAPFEAAGEGVLVISGGGARRTTLNEADAVLTRVVAFHGFVGA